MGMITVRPVAEHDMDTGSPTTVAHDRSFATACGQKRINDGTPSAEAERMRREQVQVDQGVEASILDLKERIVQLEQRQALRGGLAIDDHLQPAATSLPQHAIQSVTPEQAAKLVNAAMEVREEILGQEGALRPLLRIVVMDEMWVRPPNPRSCFLLVGHPGTGKTATGIAIANKIYGDSALCLVINSTQYRDDHSLIDLVGEGGRGRLVSHIEKNPHSVVVFQHLEGGGPALQDLLCNMTGRGYIEEAGTGRPITTHSTLVLATSHVGKQRLDGLEPEFCGPRRVQDQVEQDCQSAFRHDVMSRFNGFFIFASLRDQTIKRLALREIDKFVNELQQRVPSIPITVKEDALTYLQASALEPARFGRTRPDGRYIQRSIHNTLGQHLAVPVFVNADFLESAKGVCLGWRGWTGAKADRADGWLVAVAAFADDTADLLVRESSQEDDDSTIQPPASLPSSDQSDLDPPAKRVKPDPASSPHDIELETRCLAKAAVTRQSKDRQQVAMESQSRIECEVKSKGKPVKISPAPVKSPSPWAYCGRFLNERSPAITDLDAPTEISLDDMLAAHRQREERIMASSKYRYCDSLMHEPTYEDGQPALIPGEGSQGATSLEEGRLSADEEIPEEIFGLKK